MKNNYTQTDSDGNVIATYYGCATIQDACDLSGVTSPEDLNSNKLIVYPTDVVDSLYNVILVDNPALEYANDQAIAYSDLEVYSNKSILNKSENQYLGVLSLSDGTNTLSESACYPNDMLESNLLNYSTLDGYKISTYTTTADLLNGRIKINIGKYVELGSYSIKGVDITLIDFIDEEFNPDSLKISNLSLIDTFAGGEIGSSSDYLLNNDTSDFYIDSSQYKTIVTNSGLQKICAYTQGQSPYQSGIVSQYTNWVESNSQVNFMILFGVEEISNPTLDILMSVINVEFEYVSSEGIILKRTLTIELIINKIFASTELPGSPEIITELESSPNTIFYRTSDKSEIAGLTDDIAETLSPDNTLVSRGYDSTSDYGWITFQNPITVLDGRLIFKNYHNLTHILLWPTLMEEIVEESFFMGRNTSIIQRWINLLPNTINSIGHRAFRQFNLYGDLIIHSTSTKVYIGEQAFESNYITSLNYSSPDGFIDIDYAGFRFCYELKEGVWSSALLSSEAFAGCTSLQKVSMFSILWAGLLKERTFYECSSLLSIVLRHFTWARAFYVLRNPQAFYGCSSLKTIFIEEWLSDPEGLNEYTNRGFCSNTFRGCTGVEAIYCNTYHPPFLGVHNINKNTAINPKTCKLYVPTGRTLAYLSKAQWGDFPAENVIEYTPEQFESVKNSLL